MQSDVRYRNLHVTFTCAFVGRVGVKIVSKKIRQAVGKANRRHQVLLHVYVGSL